MASTTTLAAGAGPAPEKPSLGVTTARGAFWLIAQNTGGRIFGFLSQLVIAAILSPSNFGLIGLAYTVSTVGAMLTNFGVESVLLQRQKTIRLWVVPAFWFSFGMGLVGFLAVLAIGPVFVRIYNEPDVARLAGLIAIGIPISALSTIPTVLLRSRFNYRTIAAVNLGETVGIQGLTIAFALLGFGAYSFALPLPIISALRTAALWLSAKPELPGLFHKLGRARFLMNSSLAVFGCGIVQSAIAQGDRVVLGMFSDDAVVGIYFFAFKIASQPLLLMAMSLSNVLFPALSHLRNSPAAQGAAAFRAAKLLGLVIMPMAFLQAGVIGPALHIFFHSKWDASIPLMQILSIALGFDAIAWIAGTLLTAQRGFRLQFIYTLAFAPPFFIFVAIGGWHGSALGVAIGVAAYYALVTPIYSYVVFRRSGVRFLPLVGIYARPAALAAVSTGIGMALPGAIGLHSPILHIAVISVVSCGLYLFLLRLAEPASFREVFALGRQVVERRRKPA